MQRDYHYYVYILTNRANKVFYIGMTNSLFRRAFQHRLKENPKSFTARYNINKLVHFESYQFVGDAITREKQLKKWNRSWKERLIKENNPNWRDLFGDML